MSIQGSLASDFRSSFTLPLAEKNQLVRCSQLHAVNSLSSLNPQQELSTIQGFGIKSIWSAMYSFWNSVVSAVKSFLMYLGLLSSMTGSEREIRLRQGAENIHARLQAEFQHAQAQMDNESDKAFQYSSAGSADLHPHETSVGKYRVGICHFQGRRPTMEDEHLAESFTVKIGKKTYPIQLFGIFDGHGGPTAAQFVRDHLRKKMQKTLAEFNPTGLTDVGIWNALKMTFVRLNEDFKAAYGHKTKNYGSYGPGIISDDEGTTATVAIMLDGKVWTANVGDSRTILEFF